VGVTIITLKNSRLQQVITGQYDAHTVVFILSKQ